MDDESNELKRPLGWMPKFTKDSQLTRRADWLSQFLKENKKTTYVDFLNALREYYELQLQIINSVIAGEKKEN